MTKYHLILEANNSISVVMNLFKINPNKKAVILASRVVAYFAYFYLVVLLRFSPLIDLLERLDMPIYILTPDCIITKRCTASSIS